MFRKGLFFHWLIMAALLVTLAGLAQPALAQNEPAPMFRTITVTTTRDDISKNGNCTLREAVQAANTNKAVDRCPAGSSSSTDVIRLGKSTYSLRIAGKYENSNKKGDIDITQSVQIVGSGRSSTIIDGKLVDRVFDNRSTSATVTIRDLTIQNGYTYPKDGNVVDEGGAVANKGKMVVTRVRFRDNRAATDGDDSVRGGAVFSTGTLTVTDSIFERNHAGTGGALGSSGILKVDKCTFRANTAYLGGAIFTSGTGAKADITNSRFVANENGPGGASAIGQFEGSTTNIRSSIFEGHRIGDELIYNLGTMTIRYSTFQNNPGSPVAVAGRGSLLLTLSTVKNNTGFNGGMVRLSSGRLVLDRMTFSGNGGLALEVSGGEARLHNSTISGLTGPGAVLVRGGRLAIDSATIADNTTETVGALNVTGGTVTLHNSILANTRTQSGGVFVADCLTAAGTTTSLGYNLISRADGCGITAVNGDQFGTLAKPIDPMLGVLKFNGGSNDTRGLLPGSPAVDKADPVNSFKTDQRMYQRPAGKTDIGAYERGAVK